MADSPVAELSHVPHVADAPKPLMRNVSFQLLWTSVAAAGLGDRLMLLAAWSMLGIHNPGAQAASIQAGVSFFFFLPYVLLGSVAGWLADTLPRRWILFACDEGRAGVLLLAAVLVPAGAAIAIPESHHWKVFAIIAAVGSLAAIFSPAKAATVPQVVPAEQLQPANAIVLGIAVIASLLGLMIGGPIVEHYSVRAALGLGVVAFAISGFFCLQLKLRAHTRVAAGPEQNQAQRMWEAVRYTVQHKAVLELTFLSILFWGGAHVILAAVAALCKSVYGLPEATVVSATGTMLGCLGGGMLLSSLWVAWINTRKESGWFAMAMLLITGVAMLGLAVSGFYWIGLIMAFSVGFFGNTAMICVATLTQSIAPDYIRGRVFGVRDIVTTIAAVVINFIIWRTPDADKNMIPALIVTALILSLVALRGLLVGLSSGPMQAKQTNVFWRIVRSFTLVWHRVKWVGKHNVPSSGAVILASNHTTGLDPFVIQGPINRPVRWLMLRSYRYAILEPFWAAIDPICIEEESHQLPQMRQLLGALKQGDIVGLFPEGKLQRDVRELAPLQPGIAMLAVRSGAPIVPVWIDGTPRKKEMLWHFLKPSRCTVIYGEAFVPDASAGYDVITAELRVRMEALEAEAKKHSR